MTTRDKQEWAVIITFSVIFGGALLLLQLFGG